MYTSQHKYTRVTLFKNGLSLAQANGLYKYGLYTYHNNEDVLSVNNKECITYDQLTMGQWMVVFCRAMRAETDQNSKDAMLHCLISLLDDANDFSWNSAKASHAVLLCRIEQGEIKDYTQTEQTDRVRHTHAQRHTHPYWSRYYKECVKAK